MIRSGSVRVGCSLGGVFAAALGACSGDSANTFCGQTLWAFGFGTLVNDDYRVGEECFLVEDHGDRADFQIALGGGGDCALTGARAGDVVSFDGGECVVQSVPVIDYHLFTRWFAIGGEATYVATASSWAIRAQLDVAVLLHDGTYGVTEIEHGPGTIDHDGAAGGSASYDDSYGHPCTPAPVYHASITGRVVRAIGPMESCDALLEQVGATAAYDYTFAGDGRHVTFGDGEIDYMLMPDACVVAFETASDAYLSILDLDAGEVVITTTGTGPYIPKVGTAQCDLEWTGTVTPS